MDLRRSSLAVCAAAALALAGCGSDGSDGATGAAGAEEPPAASTQPRSPERPTRCPQPWPEKAPGRQFDSRALVGLTVAEARAKAALYGCDVRVERRDGEDLVVTEDLRPDRIGVVVDGGRITAVIGVA